MIFAQNFGEVVETYKCDLPLNEWIIEWGGDSTGGSGDTRPLIFL